LLRRKLGFVDPDPLGDADLEQHIGVVRFGNEALRRNIAFVELPLVDHLWMALGHPDCTSR
jgi:hypothetical protein